MIFWECVFRKSELGGGLVEEQRQGLRDQQRYRTQFRLTSNAHMDDALEFLRIAVIARELGYSERERLFATSSMIHAFQATEDFLGVVRTFYIISQKNVNQEGAYRMFDFLESRLADLRPIQQRWKTYAHLIAGVKLDLGASPFQEYGRLARYRNTYLHANVVWLESDETGRTEPIQPPDLGSYPVDPSMIRSEHAKEALVTVGSVLRKGAEMFVAFIPNELHEGGRFCVFKKTPDGAVHKKPFEDLLQEALKPKLSEEVSVTVPRKVLENVGIDLGHVMPPTADLLMMALRFDALGGGYTTRALGYRDPI